MIAQDLSLVKGPSLTDLKVLERLGQHRQALEAKTPAGNEEARILARALATLDDMEECLCEEGAKAPDLARGWQVLGQLEARLAQRPATPTWHRAAETFGADLPEAA